MGAREPPPTGERSDARRTYLSSRYFLYDEAVRAVEALREDLYDSITLASLRRRRDLVKQELEACERALAGRR